MWCLLVEGNLVSCLTLRWELCLLGAVLRLAVLLEAVLKLAVLLVGVCLIGLVC